MVPLAVTETSSSTRFSAVKPRLCSRVTDGWGPLTCVVPLSVSLSSSLNLGFVLFLEISYLQFAKSP